MQNKEVKVFYERAIGEGFDNTIADFSGKVGEAQVHYTRVRKGRFQIDATIKVIY